MIRVASPPSQSGRGKPRASGDDPYQAGMSMAAVDVNPARAGMIPLGAGRVGAG